MSFARFAIAYPCPRRRVAYLRHWSRDVKADDFVDTLNRSTKTTMKTVHLRLCPLFQMGSNGVGLSSHFPNDVHCQVDDNVLETPRKKTIKSRAPITVHRLLEDCHRFKAAAGHHPWCLKNSVTCLVCIHDCVSYGARKEGNPELVRRRFACASWYTSASHLSFTASSYHDKKRKTAWAKLTIARLWRGKIEFELYQ